MNCDTNRFSEEEESVHQFMGFFNCCDETARAIIESARLNGKFDSIKKMCSENARREKHNA